MTAESSTSSIKRYKPYFTPEEVEKLSTKQRGKLSVSREERNRQQACGFIDAVGVRSGFPRRTIATAQSLYLRFHLFFPLKDFNYMEVALSTLYVSSKLHDTLKKPRDIILSSYALRFPQLAKKGVVDQSSVDPNVLEGERKRVLSIERLVLETMCFHFGVEMGFGVVVKLCKAFGLDKAFTRAAWKVAIDCYRTTAPLSYPPHIIAIGSIYSAAIFLSESTQMSSEPLNSETPKSPSDIIRLFSNKGPWEDQYALTHGEVDDITHAIIDLYTIVQSTPINDPSIQFSPSPNSPRDNPLAASTNKSSANLPSALNTAFHLSSFWTSGRLTELKIHLRDRRPDKVAVVSGWPESPSEGGQDVNEGMGRNDSTVRFIWDDAAVV